MKNSKKGISLIVLVITIIVIIILAAAVILTLNNNNPIANARVAVDKSDYLEAQDAFTLWMSKVMAGQLDSVTVSGTITADPAAGNIKAKVGTSGDALTPAANELLYEVNIDALGLPSKISTLFIKDNKVVGMVKNSVHSKLDASGNVVTGQSDPDVSMTDGLTPTEPVEEEP